MSSTSWFWIPSFSARFLAAAAIAFIAPARQCPAPARAAADLPGTRLRVRSLLEPREHGTRNVIRSALEVHTSNCRSAVDCRAQADAARRRALTLVSPIHTPSPQRYLSGAHAAQSDLATRRLAYAALTQEFKGGSWFARFEAPARLPRFVSSIHPTETNAEKHANQPEKGGLVSSTQQNTPPPSE